MGEKGAPRKNLLQKVKKVSKRGQKHGAGARKSLHVSQTGELPN